MIYDNTTLKIKLKQQIRQKVQTLSQIPVLDIIQVGNHFASTKYVAIKQKIGTELGIKVNLINYPQNQNKQEILDQIIKTRLTKNGLIIQLPLPNHLYEILTAIDINQDVDLLNPNNFETLWQQGFLPPTIQAVSLVLNDIFEQNSAKKDVLQKVVVVGQGKLVGLPATRFFIQKGYQVQVVDINTSNSKQICQQADILLSATGVAGLIQPDWIKPNSIVIDAGTSESKKEEFITTKTFSDNLVNNQSDIPNSTENTCKTANQSQIPNVSKQVGDVVIENFNPQSILVPSPGGIGAITVLCLFINLLDLTKFKQ
jgi:5,10-methylene-tetrahydrofolate dehydrogenase/methenyl tetrahydrofolate cyclohydrolase